MKKWNTLICFLLISVFVSSCGNEKDQNHTPPITTEESKTLPSHLKDVPPHGKEPTGLKKEAKKKEPQQEQIEHPTKQESQSTADTPANKKQNPRATDNDQEAKATPPTNKQPIQQQALAQQEQQLLEELRPLFKDKAWETVEKRFHAAKGNLAKINTEINLITQRLNKFKPLYRNLQKEKEEDIEEDEEEDDERFCPPIGDLQVYVRVLNNLTKVQIDEKFFEFIDQLDVKKPNPFCGKKLEEKYDKLQVASSLRELLENPTYMHAFKQVNEKLLAIYQNFNQQAILNQPIP